MQENLSMPVEAIFEDNRSQITLEDLKLEEDLVGFLETRSMKIHCANPEQGIPLNYIEFEHHQKLPVELPSGYGYSGGVARTTILSEMKEKVVSPRDIDIVAVKELNPDLALQEELSEKYMPEDAKHGYGVGIVSLEEYFTNRDFVLNEVLVVGNKVYATPEALQDLREKIVRPTAYEKEGWTFWEEGTNGVKPKLVMKALRILTELEDLYGEGKLEGIEDWQFELRNVPLFYIALQLEKAYENGDNIAQGFFTKLIKQGTLNYSLTDRPDTGHAQSPEELAISLRWGMGEEEKDPFDFSKRELNKPIDPKYYHYIESFEQYEDAATGLPIKNTGNGKDRYGRREANDPTSKRPPEQRLPEVETIINDLNKTGEPVPTAMEFALKKALEKRSVR